MNSLLLYVGWDRQRSRDERSWLKQPLSSIDKPPLPGCGHPPVLRTRKLTTTLALGLTRAENTPSEMRALVMTRAGRALDSPMGGERARAGQPYRRRRGHHCCTGLRAFIIVERPARRGSCHLAAVLHRARCVVECCDSEQVSTLLSGGCGMVAAPASQQRPHPVHKTAPRQGRAPAILALKSPFSARE